MKYFLFTLLIIGLVIIGMAIGLILRGKKIERSCDTKKKIMGESCSKCVCNNTKR